MYGIELRGYGETPRNSDRWSLPNKATNDVAQVLDWIQRRHPQMLSDLILYGYLRDPGAPVAVLPTPATPLCEATTRERALSGSITSRWS